MCRRPFSSCQTYNDMVNIDHEDCNVMSRADTLDSCKKEAHIIAYFIKQPDLTLFYIIFTYLWGRYLWSFRNYGSNVALYNFLSHKPTKVTSDFILNYLKKVVGGATTEIYQNQMLKPWYFLYGSTPRGPRGVKRCVRIH